MSLTSYKPELWISIPAGSIALIIQGRHLEGISGMLLRTLFLAPILFISSLAFADSSKSKDAGAAQTPPKVTAPDSSKLSESVNGSFYHPDGLSGIQCTIAMNWSDFYNALKMKVPEERMHKIESLQIHSTAFRGKTAELTFDWLKGPADTKDELEGGMKQIIGGFYQTYWSLMATAPIPRARDISRIEPQPDGTTKLFEADANNKIEIDLDSKQTPTHYAFDTAAFKGTFDLQYVDSPKPSPGDLRRLSDSHIVANIGASSFNVGIHLDYQQVDGFFVPRHVSYDIAGAYSVSLEFIGCSTMKPRPLAAIPSQ